MSNMQAQHQIDTSSLLGVSEADGKASKATQYRSTACLLESLVLLAVFLVGAVRAAVVSVRVGTEVAGLLSDQRMKELA
eukprot:6400441-Amphidinium_carterae.1